MRTDEQEFAGYLRDLGALKGLDDTAAALPLSRFARLGELNFHYLEWGEPSAPPLILLHGGAQTAHTWDLVCLSLSKRYRCLALDQRGHGDSDWAPDLDYAIPTYRRDLQRFVDHLGIDRFILIGMSMGGINAMDYAATCGERLAALVLVDIAPEVERMGAERSILAAATAPASFPSLRHAVEHALRGRTGRDRRLVEIGLRRRMRPLPDGSWSWKYDRRRYASVGTEEFLEERRYLWGEVGRISCPVLVLRGALSDVLLDDGAARLAAALPRGEWKRIPDAGHSIQSDNPKGLAEAVEDFLLRRMPDFAAQRPGP